MKCVETYKHRDEAKELQRLLKERGIDARLLVDPLESLYPALSDMQGVALMVRDEQFQAAERLIGDRHKAFRKAS